MQSNNDAISIDQLLSEGARVVDVRSKSEFESGHVRGSINIPLNEVEKRLAEIKSISHPIVLCCASGMRSGTARTLLRSLGVKDVFNGGAWQQLEQTAS